MRQWIVSSLGGAPDRRERDKVTVISGLTTDQLTRIYTIQKYEVSGVKAVLHVVEHFAQHTGQIIFATKLLTGEDMGFYRHLSATKA